MKILFLCPYPHSKAPSQRFRYEQYLLLLNNSNIEYEIHSFLSNSAWNILYQPGKFHLKAIHIFIGFLKRFFLLFSVFKFNYVFIHREAAPIGPPVFEWIIAKLLRKKIVYDFDDAIWLHNSSESNKSFSFLKFYSNTKYICKWAYKVSCGNQYLCDFAKQYNQNVVYNPTTIDTQNYHNVSKEYNFENLFTIGWTGSHSTNQYLQFLVPILHELEKKYSFRFLVISDINPQLPIKSFEFCKWQKETEVQDLLKLDIGLMPLHNDLWAMGKCGFKALQYMSLGIPAIVSPVGVNTKIVEHNLNGFVCNTEQEWKQTLSQILEDKHVLKNISLQSQLKIQEFYSVKCNTQNFINLFK
jgi:glycosyltransferase involved in cell wall biosynthesis